MKPKAKQIKRTVKRATTTKSVEKRTGGEVKSEEIKQESAPFDLQEIANPAYVNIGTAYTHNLGNYESVKISCSISMPCIPKAGEIKKTKEKIVAMVDSIMAEELGKVKEETE